MLSGSLRPVVFIGDIKEAKSSAGRGLQHLTANTDLAHPNHNVIECTLVVYEIINSDIVTYTTLWLSPIVPWSSTVYYLDPSVPACHTTFILVIVYECSRD